MDRPNFLWICADDLAIEACGCYGSAYAKTPAIDGIAKRGLVFDQAVCNSPLSTPSRQSFWTGRYPRSIGVTLSPTSLPKEEVTLPDLLSRNGYQTAAFGKTHYYSPRKHEFDVCADHTEHAHWLATIDRQTIDSSEHVLGPWRPMYDHPSVWLNSDCLPCASIDFEMADAFYARQASRFLSKEVRSPFFLYVSFVANHSPFRFPIEYRGRIRPDRIDVPTPSASDLVRLPRVFLDLTVEEKQGIIAAYHTATEYLDANVSRVLNALEQSPNAENTIVIFTSDHGYSLGQHGRFEKHSMYDESTRTALIVSHPLIIESGKRTQALVELFDLMPTLLDFAGISVPGNVQARSLRPVLDGRSSNHRAQVFVEYAGSAEAMVRTDQHKLTFQAGGWTRHDGYSTGRPTTQSIRLFDLNSDPSEQHDLATRPEYQALQASLLNDLLQHLKSTARTGLPNDGGDQLAAVSQLVLPAEIII